jgi:hypothetical protein
MGAQFVLNPEFSMTAFFRELEAVSDPARPAGREPSTAELQESTNDVREWLKIKLRTGKCSQLLMRQLARHNLSHGETFDGHTFYFEPYEIYSEIERLETGSSKGRAFTQGLAGLYHTHHSRTVFITKNLLRQWKAKVRASGLSEREYLMNQIKATLPELAAGGLSQSEAVQRVLPTIAYKELMDSVESPTKTGERLIYAISDNTDYYLTLAYHREPVAGIWARVEQCLSDFPILKTLLPR